MTYLVLDYAREYAELGTVAIRDGRVNLVSGERLEWAVGMSWASAHRALLGRGYAVKPREEG